MRSIGNGNGADPFLDDATVERAVSDPSSRQVLVACMDQARSVRDISHETGMALATTYRHVNRLQEDGLLIVERSAISEDGKKYDLYRSRVRHVRMELTPKGMQIDWQVDEAVEDRLHRMWQQMRL